ncbi:unnamed protein product [Musa acuminata subsp. malaccensis]|uniref:(wild Malaysian banana) hypothetical protein n=1 Tax=Musa acuminata subsp. malaccensis TaxID=214687 RepID=A0A804KID4_MUSAM|nr:unnamed protein product [Musa acuminata subsp. malaccensis]
MATQRRLSTKASRQDIHKAFKPSARINRSHFAYQRRILFVHARFPKKYPPLLHVLVSSDSCRGGTGFKGSSDAFGEVDAFRALHIVSLLHVKEVLGICLRICGVFYSR